MKDCLFPARIFVAHIFAPACQFRDRGILLFYPVFFFCGAPAQKDTAKAGAVNYQFDAIRCGRWFGCITRKSFDFSLVLFVFVFFFSYSFSLL